MAETKSISIDASKSVRGRPPVLPDGVSVKLDQATGMLEVLLLTVQDQKIELFETTPGLWTSSCTRRSSSSTTRNG